MRVDVSWEARVCTTVLSTLMRQSNEDESRWELRSESLHESSLSSDAPVKRGWELMRVEKREFAREFSQLSCASQTRMRVDESWEARVCTRVLSTLMRQSNEDESRWELRSESLHESSLNSDAPVKRGWELMRVEKREFAREFSQLWCAGQTRMRVGERWEARVCTRVLSTLMRQSNEDESRWELRSESLHESSLNSDAPVKRGESWWELRSESLHESSLNSDAPIKRGESWWELRSESLHESSLNSDALVEREWE